MKKNVLFLICITILFKMTVWAQGIEKKTFMRTSQWQHDTDSFGREFVTLVDKDDHLIGGFYKSPFRIISAEKIVLFAPYGQGPNDLTNAMAGFIHKGDLAIVEMPNKIKVFTKKNGTYVWKETKWLKTGKYPQIVKGGTYFEKKIFLAGVAPVAGKNNKMEAVHLLVYDDKGKPLKALIKKTFNGSNEFMSMKYHVAGYKEGMALYLQENELKVTIITTKDLEVSGEKLLEIPPFYKKMPGDFYVFKQYGGNRSAYRKDLETWSMGYSAIKKVAVVGDYLVVQIRTCSDKLKKFALLFYNVEKKFKLEKTVFNDDYLLGTRAGKYYCFANGNPGRDEDTDDVIINIYEFVR